MLSGRGPGRVVSRATLSDSAHCLVRVSRRFSAHPDCGAFASSRSSSAAISTSGLGYRMELITLASAHGALSVRVRYWARSAAICAFLSSAGIFLRELIVLQYSDLTAVARGERATARRISASASSLCTDSSRSAAKKIALKFDESAARAAAYARYAASRFAVSIGGFMIAR